MKCVRAYVCIDMCICVRTYVCKYDILGLDQFLRDDRWQRPRSLLRQSRLFNVHVHSLLDPVYEIFVEVATSGHDAASSRSHCACELCLMIMHECIINDDEEAFAKRDGFRDGSSARVGDDDARGGDVGGEIGGEGEGGDGGVGRRRLRRWRGPEGRVTVLNCEGGYAESEKGAEDGSGGCMVCEGGELGRTDSDEEGERHDAWWRWGWYRRGEGRWDAREKIISKRKGKVSIAGDIC